MESVQLYIRVNNLGNSTYFLTEIASIFKVEFNDIEVSECILSLQNNNTVKLCVRENSQPSLVEQTESNTDYIFALGIDNCKAVYDKIRNQVGNFDWKISQEFFGEYLSTPTGDQFAIVEKTGNKILIFDKVI